MQTISQRVGAYLEREGLLVRDIENTYLQLEAPNESTMSDLLGHSITYRIAVGPQAGCKAFTLQTVPARQEENDNPQLVKTGGFSLHATAERPDELYVADITYLPTWAGFLFLAVVQDVSTRRVVGWAMANHLRTALVVDALNMALSQRRPQNVIHHSDQGTQYTPIKFGQRCR